MKKIRLISANLKHAELLYIWANEPEVRSNSINQHNIIWEDHLEWFKKKIISEDYLLIMEIDDIPVGQVRFDFDPKKNYWIINYSISKENRGKGFGKILVSYGIDYVKEFPIIAFVKPTNIPSLKVFESLNFVKMETNNIKGVDYFKYIKLKN